MCAALLLFFQKRETGGGGGQDRGGGGGKKRIRRMDKKKLKANLIEEFIGYQAIIQRHSHFILCLLPHVLDLVPKRLGTGMVMCVCGGGGGG